MVDVQLSGVAPAGGAGAAGYAGPGVAPVFAVAAASQSTAGSKASSPDGTTAGDAAPIAPAQAPGAVAGAAQPKAAKPDGLQVKDDVKNANQALAAIGTQLVFVFDDQAHHLAVKLLDIQTQKVVQQIPTAAMHATASALSGPSASGALVDTKA